MKFTKDHEWIKFDEGMATVGITDYAAEALGELVYVELPKVGASFKKGDAIAVVESSKSASDVYSPISGTVVKVNESLKSNPELVNNSSFEDGWIVKIKTTSGDDSEVSGEMDEASYKKYLQNH